MLSDFAALKYSHDNRYKNYQIDFHIISLQYNKFSALT